MLDGHSSNYSGNGQSYPQKEVDFLFGNRKTVTGAECDGKSRCWRVTLPFQACWEIAGEDRDTPTFIWADKAEPRCSLPCCLALAGVKLADWTRWACAGPVR